MSHRDFRAKASAEPTLQIDSLRRALARLLNGADFDGVRFRDDCRWVPRSLVAAALLWAWSDEATLVERFETAVRIALRLDDRQDDSGGSYQAFVKLLVRWTGLLSAALKSSLRRRMRRLKRAWTIDGALLFAVDGTRIELPRTRQNEQAFAATRKRSSGVTRKRSSSSRKKRKKKRNAAAAKKAKAPQLWLTTLFHVGSGLPWNWRIGPADASERAHFRDMLDSLPEEAIVAADAGYVGYDLVAAVLASGRGLLLRVGGNAKLLRKLGCVRESAGTVYLWPDKIAKKRQPPLVLRLIEAHDGKRSIHVLTSASVHVGLSDRRALELYRRRWGVELFYRSLKRTFRRRKLRSASPAPALVEMEWSLLGLWTTALYALEAIVANGKDPRRLSCAKLLRAFRRTLRDWRCEVEPGRTLRARLERALIDDYARGDKSSRDWPRKKQERPPGPPVVVDASPAQRLAARTLLPIS
jgi:hypothetical protein